MSYIKTVWMNNQTPLSAENLNHIEDGIEQNSQNIDDVPIIKSVGKDSLVQKTVDDEVARANTAAGNYSGAFGSRNSIFAGSNETFAFGGRNEITRTEDALIAGYRNVADVSHQSIIGGYKNTVKASESIVVGDQHTIEGTITTTVDGSTTDTRKLAVFGLKHHVYGGTQHSLISGEQNEVGSVGKWNIAVGYKQKLGGHNECINSFGYENEIKDYVTDSTVFGWSNTIKGGTNNSNKAYNVFMFGNGNTNQDPSNSNRGLSNVYLIGDGLQARHAKQIVVGSYNSGDGTELHDMFSVGAGASNSNRHTCFGAGYLAGGVDFIRIGYTTLTETQLQALLALL